MACRPPSPPPMERARTRPGQWRAGVRHMDRHTMSSHAVGAFGVGIVVEQGERKAAAEPRKEIELMNITIRRGYVGIVLLHTVSF
jgi:hypothetical protein